MVPGGLDVMSKVTRLTCAISLIMREAAYGYRAERTSERESRVPGQA